MIFVAKMMQDLKNNHQNIDDVTLSKKMSDTFFCEKGGIYIIVASLKDRIIGYSLYQDFFEPYIVSTGFHLCDIYVEKEFRQQNVGLLMFKEICRHAVEADRKFIWWMFEPENKTAESFYKKVGAKMSDSVSATIDPSSFSI